ncbi:unnamed protein product [Angiostrongylus costaricensis]|uniref:Coiled-coil domain-containing protein 176 n=1 Tax=Angiostrongylus costaricensis TaxID=334426 RepID=A0A0R3PZ22_ANGCS|nr:unnamed protein product [Angiostrongylus costaricensis]
MDILLAYERLRALHRFSELMSIACLLSINHENIMVFSTSGPLHFLMTLQASLSLTLSSRDTPMLPFATYSPVEDCFHPECSGKELLLFTIAYAAFQATPPAVNIYTPPGKNPYIVTCAFRFLVFSTNNCHSLLKMDDFIAHLNTLELKSTTDMARLEELRRTNAMKQEMIALMKKELARYEESDKERNEKRENLERQHEMIVKNVAENLSSAESFSAELETLHTECANQMKNRDEVQTKLSDLRTQLSRIAESEKRLRSDVRDLKETPGAIAPDLIKEMRSKQADIRKAISDRFAKFDLKAIVAKMEEIEEQRRRRLEMAKELEVKYEMSARLDAENEALASQLQKLQTKFSVLLEKKEKIVRQNEDYARRLDEMELEKAHILKISESMASEREKIRRETAIVMQETAENEKKISLAKHSLEEMKAEVLQKEEALRELKEHRERQEQQMAAELENMTNEFEKRCDILLKRQERYSKASEEARAEIEKMKRYEKFRAAYDEKCRKISEMQEKLLKLKEHHSNLLKKQEEKERERAEQFGLSLNLFLQKARVETVRREVEAKKRETDARIEDMKAENRKLDAKIMAEKQHVKILENTIYEIDGKICLEKHLVSAKREELRRAKIKLQGNFTQSGDGAAELTPEKQNLDGRQEERLSRKRPMEKAGNKREVQLKRRFSFDDRKSNRGIAQKENEVGNDQDRRIECIGKNNDTNKVDEGKDFTTAYQLRRHFCTRKARSVEIEGEQSSNSQHTTSLASMLAEEFKRDITVDRHGGVVKHDDGGELFGRPGNIAHNKSILSKTTIANTALMANAAERRVKGGKKTVRFELSELSTSTSGTVKKQ